MTMKATCLLILASLVFCNLTASGGQGVPGEDETDRRTIDDIVLQRAESLLLRSILRKMQDDDGRNEGSSSQTEWVAKRQHPGKRHSEDLEKRQHPGRRDEGEDEENLEAQKRQHPGKREDDMNPLTELQKRQHPGKRLLVLRSKRQHPGKRHPEDGDGDGTWDADADADGDADLAEVEKRQHPGKRFWDNSSPDLGTNGPCDVLDPASCSKASLLLDFIGNMNKSHAEEKRQHPGRRVAPEEGEADGE